MVCFQTKNPNLGKFWRVLHWKMLVYIFYGHFVHFTVFWYILWSFGIVCGHLVNFFPFWYVWTKKNLATLISALGIVTVLCELHLKNKLNIIRTKVSVVIRHNSANAITVNTVSCSVENHWHKSRYKCNGDMVECQPTKCQPAKCQPTECQFF
jgi:hypothetical protein